MKRELFSLFVVILVGEVVGLNGINITQLSAASSRFSKNLYQQVALKKKNVVYSPLSIHLSLTLTWFGARETTATQMADTLNLTLFGDSAPHPAYHELINQLKSARDVEICIGNALFVNPKIPLTPDFVTAAKFNYFSLASHFDLNTPGGPEKTMNNYINNKTHGMIKRLLPQGIVDSSTSLVIISTLFFNGTWDRQFNKSWTIKKTFYKLGGETSEVDMMRDVRRTMFKNTEKYMIAQLPFKNKRFGLYIISPKEFNGITELEGLLQSRNTIDEWFSDMIYILIDLGIPKFKIETSLSLRDPLRSLGMKNAFEQHLANFSGISPKRVHINKVIHKAVFEVQETGTVEADVTTEQEYWIPPNYILIAQAPFLFFLRDNESKQILFQGKFSG